MGLTDFNSPMNMIQQLNSGTFHQILIFKLVVKLFAFLTTSNKDFDRSTVPKVNKISQPFPGILVCIRLTGRHIQRPLS